MKRFFTVVAIFIFITLFALPAAAAPWEARSGNETIRKGETIPGDLIFTGQQLVVDGEIQGDLVVLAGRVEIKGRVGGSLIGFVSDRLDVDGTIAGNLRVIGGMATVLGKVGGSTTGIMIKLDAVKGSEITNGVFGRFSMVSLLGNINGPVTLWGYNNTRIGGRINGDVTVHGIKPVWKAPLNLTGKVLDYTEGSDPHKIKGVKTGDYRTAREEISFAWVNKIFLFLLIWFIGSLLMSIIFYRLFPVTAWRMTEPTLENFRRNMRIGLFSFLGIPLAALLFAVTVVGIPIAVLLVIFYIVLMLFSSIPINLWVGRILFKNRFHPIVKTILGCLALVGVSILPLVNMILSVITAMVGFGMIVGSIRFQVNETPGIDFQA